MPELPPKTQEMYVSDASDMILCPSLFESDSISGDDIRPICTKCKRSGEECEWDAFIKFRPPTGLAGSRDSTPSGPITLRVQSDSEVRNPDSYRFMFSVLALPSLTYVGNWEKRCRTATWQHFRENTLSKRPT